MKSAWLCAQFYTPVVTEIAKSANLEVSKYFWPCSAFAATTLTVKPGSECHGRWDLPTKLKYLNFCQSMLTLFKTFSTRCSLAFFVYWSHPSNAYHRAGFCCHHIFFLTFLSRYANWYDGFASLVYMQHNCFTFPETNQKWFPWPNSVRFSLTASLFLHHKILHKAKE